MIDVSSTLSKRRSYQNCHFDTDRHDCALASDSDTLIRFCYVLTTIAQCDNVILLTAICSGRFLRKLASTRFPSSISVGDFCCFIVRRSYAFNRVISSLIGSLVSMTHVDRFLLKPVCRCRFNMSFCFTFELQHTLMVRAELNRMNLYENSKKKMKQWIWIRFNL